MCLSGELPSGGLQKPMTHAWACRRSRRAETLSSPPSEETWLLELSELKFAFCCHFCLQLAS